MIAAWSLWTKPLRELPFRVWATDRHHLLSWILSVETARKHYPRTGLITDDEGARLLVDRLGLTFDSVSTELNALEGHDPNWWALGKLYAYRAQQEPFVHIDADVYLWNKLPDHVERAPVFAQNVEPIVLPNAWYDINEFQRLAERGAWIPREIPWFRDSGRPLTAIVCGILGGSDVDFVNYYACTAIRLVEQQPNRDLWLPQGTNNLLVEQFFLSACIEHRGFGADAPAGSPRARYLFDNGDDPYNPAAARRIGYTHLLGGAKRNPYLLTLLERRVRNHYPSYFERCCKE